MDRTTFELEIPIGEDGSGEAGCGGHGPNSLTIDACSDKKATAEVEPEGADSKIVVAGAKPGTVTISFSVPA